jgi:RNA-directed DNA polymerase
MSTAQVPMYDWNKLPWRTIERRVFKLQKRIYRAANRGDTRTVHALQRLMTRSWTAKCLAVRRVTQDNRGKRTAGVDGRKNLSPTQRTQLVSSLSLPQKAPPTRRVWIPKRGTDELRPLGIPTMRDRAAQALAKLALEPEWEAHFEPNSYGFRPGRSAHDAIEAIFNAIHKQAKYVLDADIAKCFDRIDQQALLARLHTYPTLRRAIRAWLRAGVMDGADLFPTLTGTPQGGVISPLLANIALHGLESAISSTASVRSTPPRVVRYADDFVVLHDDLAAVEQATARASDWLATMGLELKPSKTRIAHTLRIHQGAAGFDFLGFTVRQFPVGRTHSGKYGRGGRLLGFKTIIKPSKEAVKRHLAAVKDVIGSYQTAPQEVLVRHLNPVMRGWSNYYRSSVAKVTFRRLDHMVYEKLRAWAQRRHQNKSRRWVANKYWRLGDGLGWTFALRGGVRLHTYARTPIQRHTKVAGVRSPFDGDWPYWAARLGRHPDLPPPAAYCLKRQNGKCARCGLFFTLGDSLIESDHRIPRAQGGPHGSENRQLLHGHCHQSKTADDLRVVAVGTMTTTRSSRSRMSSKVSCPVLQAGRPGDRPT